MRLKTRQSCSVDELKDGDVATVIFWEHRPAMREEIVQRYGKRLIILGKRSGQCFPSLFESTHSDSIVVRKLLAGEAIIL